MKVLEVIQRSAEYLGKKGVESPRLASELLLSHILGVPRLNLYLEFERVLSEGELGRMRQLVRRRGNREPLQHLVGSTSFRGLELKVTPAVLIPRAETEILAERAWNYLEAAARVGSGAVRAMDFGTGSGCLAIAMAVHCRSAEIYGVDISREALEIARENAARHGVSDRVHFVEGLQRLAAGLQFELVVSNPPYIPRAEIARLQPEVRDYDPGLALDGGAGGLDFYRWLASEMARWLKSGGRMMLEIGDGQRERIEQILRGHNWIVEEVSTDYTGRPRVMTARLGDRGRAAG